jgi:hypothetical protein
MVRRADAAKDLSREAAARLHPVVLALLGSYSVEA